MKSSKSSPHMRRSKNVIKSRSKKRKSSDGRGRKKKSVNLAKARNQAINKVIATRNMMNKAKAKAKSKSKSKSKSKCSYHYCRYWGRDLYRIYRYVIYRKYSAFCRKNY